ncbi:MAG TPA: ABC transporter substrate-binding protein [Capillimicrobium sp.]|jgi:branched-chain amino acid transport system substrate-binding protein
MQRLRAGAIAAASIAAVLALGACGSDDEGSSTSAGGGSATTAEEGPIVIGAAVDNSDFMSSIDQPPLAAAKIAAEQINADGGVGGRDIVFKEINTQLDPEKTRAAATQLIEDGADVLWVTCDVDLSTPSIQVGLEADKLVVAPCIGTDQMGPKRFGEQGKLAYSFGNVAQDEGVAMAQTAIDKGWKTANVITDKFLVYTQNVCQAFTQKFEELGGTVAAQESFTGGDNTINGVVNKVNGSDADVEVICTTAGADLPAFVTGLRGLGNDTPILGPWAIDGTYWLPKNKAAADNIHLVTFASIYGDDPDPKVQKLIDDMKAAGADVSTGGFITGPAAVEAIAKAIEENDGSTEGEALATTIEGFSPLETSMGPISFSPEFHTVFGREYRVIEIEQGKPKLSGTVTADAPVELAG